MGIERRPDETEEQYRRRYRAYHRAWRKRAKSTKSENYVRPVTVPENVESERAAAMSAGYLSICAALMGDPLIGRSALDGR